MHRLERWSVGFVADRRWDQRLRSAVASVKARSLLRPELQAVLLLGSGALAVALGVAWVLAGQDPESTIFDFHLVPMARWLRGEEARELVTYPIWGYPALLALLPVPLLRALQLVGAVIALGFTWVVLRRRLPDRALAILLLAAIPWYALAEALWPTAPAAMLSLAGLLVIALGLERNRLDACVTGGLLLGLAANFRSEVLAIVFALPFVALLGAALRCHWARPAHAATASLVALAMLVPWALHMKQTTGRIGLTSTNGGMVALISLGQLQPNPWGIAHQDAFADTWLAERGLVTSPMSPEADRALRRGFLEAVARHPGAYAKKVGNNLRLALLGGLYVGQLPRPMHELREIDVVRERWKERLGLFPNAVEIAAYRRSGEWEQARVSPRALLALAWESAGFLGGAAFMLCGIAGLVMARRRLRHDAVLAIFAVAIVVQLALAGLLQSLPRHTTWLYPLMAPFVILCLRAVFAWPKRWLVLALPRHRVPRRA